MTEEKSRKPDRRVARTRAQLHVALVSLMQERGYDALTVQDVLDRADVGRSTFYAHFSGKEALLDEGFEHLAAELREHGRVEEGEDEALSFVRPMLEHAQAHKKLYRALVGKRAAALVQQRVRRVMTEIAKDALRPRAAEFDVPVDALVEHLVGAFLFSMTWWLDHRTGLDAEAMSAHYLRMAVPAVEAARKRSPARR